MQKAILYLSKKDPIFKAIIQQYGVPAIPSRPPGFETLVLFILEQKVSLASAKATFLKLKEMVDSISPVLLFTLSEGNYRAAGVSHQKTVYIKSLSAAILNGSLNLESLLQKSEKEVRECLIKIKGIGNWTIDVYLMFCLKAEDILPLGDIAVINTIKELLNIHGLKEIEAYTIKWSPYRSAACYLLWHHYLSKRNRKVSY